MLFILASILKGVFAPFLYSYGLIRCLMKGQFHTYHKDLAVSKDQYGNVLGQYFFNDCWITKDGYKFGKPDETISSVEGKNKHLGTFRKFGKFIADILNGLEKGHVENAIEYDERKNNIT